MGESSLCAAAVLVPAVKSELSPLSPMPSHGIALLPLPPLEDWIKVETEEEEEEGVDKDMFCPICMQIITDAFLTACGHSFCYMCIVTHLHNKNDCPCCSRYLTPSNIFPNLLLNKVSLSLYFFMTSFTS